MPVSTRATSRSSSKAREKRQPRVAKTTGKSSSSTAKRSEPDTIQGDISENQTDNSAKISRHSTRGRNKKSDAVTLRELVPSKEVQGGQPTASIQSISSASYEESQKTGKADRLRGDLEAQQGLESARVQLEHYGEISRGSTSFFQQREEEKLLRSQRRSQGGKSRCSGLSSTTDQELETQRLQSGSEKVQKEIDKTVVPIFNISNEIFSKVSNLEGYFSIMARNLENLQQDFKSIYAGVNNKIDDIQSEIKDQKQCLEQNSIMIQKVQDEQRVMSSKYLDHSVKLR